jgi:hypothetical protein
MPIPWSPPGRWQRLRMTLLLAIVAHPGLLLPPRTAIAQHAVHRPPIQIIPDCDYPKEFAMAKSGSAKATATVPVRPPSAGKTEGSAPPVTWECTPPYETPVYTRPGDDGIALAAQLEVAGYTQMANTGWMGATAGSFCGSGKQLAVASSHRIEFTILGGPTPNAVSDVIVENSNALGTLRAISSGKWNNAPYDAIVAVRNIIADDIADVFLEQFTPDCHALDLIAKGTVGN